MCFSATASFGLSAVLLPAGIYALAKARKIDRHWIPFAAYPIAFAIQQAAEGLLWLGISADNQQVIASTSRAFLFFSHFFWLSWVPLSAYWFEPSPRRRTALLCLTWLGALFGLSMFLPILVRMDWLSVELVRHSLEYKTTLIYDGIVDRPALRVFYALIVVCALFLSSIRRVRIFGALVVVSLLVTYLLFAHAFISVWCFFAAMLSTYLVLAPADRRERTLSPARPLP